jgi:DNA (cytosine-5)-methyltransferase 1
MWYHMARVVSEVRPRFVFVENSPMLIHRGIGRVLGDLSCLGYDSRWTVMGAYDVGAPHQRDRTWIVAHTRHGGGGDIRASQTRPESSKEWSAHPNQIGRPSEQSETLAHASTSDVQRQRKSLGIRQERDTPSGTGWWAIEPQLGRVADGVAARVDRLKAIGNGQVPLCAATAWRILSE